MKEVIEGTCPHCKNSIDIEVGYSIEGNKFKVRLAVWKTDSGKLDTFKQPLFNLWPLLKPATTTGHQ